MEISADPFDADNGIMHWLVKYLKCFDFWDFIHQ